MNNFWFPDLRKKDVTINWKRAKQLYKKFLCCELLEILKFRKEKLSDKIIKEINESIEELDDSTKHKTFGSAKEFLKELDE